MKLDLDFLLQKSPSKERKHEKNMFFDLNLSRLPQTIKEKQPVKPISAQSEEKKSPQFQISRFFFFKKNPFFLTFFPQENDDFQTANFSGLQQFLMRKSRENVKNLEKTKENTQNLVKSRSENRIGTPTPRKNSKTESEFSDFNNLSSTELTTIEKKSKEIKQKVVKTPILVKKPENERMNFKKTKEKGVFSNKNIEKEEKSPQKRSLTPNYAKIPKIAKNNEKIMNNSKISKISKKNLKEVENTSNNSSEEEPLQIKISLDLKKFNRNINKEEKEFEGNQFLKNVVKDIDKLTQKMLSNNNNLSMNNTSQGFFLLCLVEILGFFDKVSEKNRKIVKKTQNNNIFSSSQQSETRFFSKNIEF